jgi:hypothetical protein
LGDSTLASTSDADTLVDIITNLAHRLKAPAGAGASF